MQKLFEPDVGLMVWTAVTFLLLVYVLGRYGWRPLMAALDEREARLKAEREAAERARREAERIQADLDARLADMDRRARETMAEAARAADALRAKHAAEAEAEARRLLERTRVELEEEKRRLVAQLRAETAGLAIQAAERLVRKSIDPDVRRSAMDEFLGELERKGPARG